MTIKRILCPVDFFPASDSAVRYAVALSAGSGAKIHMLHVITPVAPGAYVPYNEETVRAIGEIATRKMESLAAVVTKSGAAVETNIRKGDVYDEIKRAIGLVKPQLVVAGTHGRTGINRWFLGSTTEKLLRHCPVPILTINTRFGKTVSARRLRRILVTTDFSSGTTEALAYALSLARTHGSQVLLLHVVDDIAADVSGRYRDMLIKGVQKQLDDLVPPETRDWCNVATRVVTGRAARIILRMLTTEMIDLVVMNIHGKTLLDRAMIGSTAERVVRAANCPVLLVPTLKRKPRKTQRQSRKQIAAP